jgi:hypothetical protein
LRHAARVAATPARTGRRGSLRPVSALPSYVLDKLQMTQATHKEFNMRLADPSVASNPTEYTRISKQVRVS